MSSVRVPDDLREQLNEAAPPGRALHEVVEALLENAGGPEQVRERLEEESRRAEAKARIARLRREGHRSVRLGEGEQVALAEAAKRWCRILEERGRRRWDRDARTLAIAADPRAGNESGEDAGLGGKGASRDRIRPEGRFASDGRGGGS